MRKESRLLRIGVLGCGPIAQFAHFEACRKARNAELYAICDAAGDLVQRMAAIHEPRATYTDYNAMLADPQVEAVIVAVAHQFHVPLCRKAIAAGKHVLVEKPLGITVEECAELRADVRGSGLAFQVGNNRRFDPGVTFARRFISEEIGQRLSLKAWYYDSVYRYTMTDNLHPIPITSAHARRPAGDPKADRRRYLLLTHGCHLVDTARFLGGEITAVRTRLLERFCAFCWYVDAQMADGSLGHLDLTIPARGDFEEGFVIQGEHGSVKGRVPLTWYHKAGDVECFSTRTGQYHRPLGEDSFTFKLQLEGFADTILNGAPQHGANVDDGTAAVRLLVAIARSVDTGEWIRPADVQGGV
jgi:predicted dehydrogenase